MSKLVILSASSGKNLELAKSIEEMAQSMGFTSEVMDLIELDLPLYSIKEESKGIPCQAKELTEVVKSAGSLVFLSPEYNGSIAPSFNNAIAWISRATEDWREAFSGKSALIGTHSGGGGAHVLMALRMQLSFIGMNVLGRQILTNFSKPLNPESLKSCLGQLK